jgi:hypothetical protein
MGKKNSDVAYALTGRRPLRSDEYVERDPNKGTQKIRRTR